MEFLMGGGKQKGKKKKGFKDGRQIIKSCIAEAKAEYEMKQLQDAAEEASKGDIIGALVGLVMGMLGMSSGGKAGDKDDDMTECLLDAFGEMGLQDGDWKNWISAEEYIMQGGFQGNDKGQSILGLLVDGDYHQCVGGTGGKG